MPIEWVDNTHKLINTPPGHLVAGGVLASLVWKCFERIEGLLTETSKLEIALWLVGVNTSARWEKALSAYVRAVCGGANSRGRVLPVAAFTGIVSTVLAYGGLTKWVSSIHFNGAVFPDGIPVMVYIAVFLSQLNIALIGISFADRLAWNEDRSAKSFARRVLPPIARFTSLVLIVVLWWVNRHVSKSLDFPQSVITSIVIVLKDFPVNPFVRSLFISTIWLWLYVIAGMILRFACRFDLGFQWFNRKVDIEKKPLQYVGSVAGCLVALLYWSVVWWAR